MMKISLYVSFHIGIRCLLHAMYMYAFRCYQYTKGFKRNSFLFCSFLEVDYPNVNVSAENRGDAIFEVLYLCYIMHIPRVNLYNQTLMLLYTL